MANPDTDPNLDPPDDQTLFEIDEIAAGHPPQVTPEQGTKLMKDRLEQLEQQEKSLAKAFLEKGPHRNDEYANVVNAIRQTKQRLSEYEAQLKGRN